MFVPLFLVLFYILFLFFFLMIRRPPRSTLFPTRRSSDLEIILDPNEGDTYGLMGVWLLLDEKDEIKYMFAPDIRYNETKRSEEHTSELQSRRDLVCRLLLEKKKKKI